MNTEMLTIAQGLTTSPGVALQAPGAPGRQAGQDVLEIESPVTSGKVRLEGSIDHGATFHPMYIPGLKEPITLVPGGILTVAPIRVDKIRLVSDAPEVATRTFAVKVSR